MGMEPTEARVFDESERIIILTPCFDRQSTTDYNESLTLCKQFPTAKFRLADGSVQSLPVVAGSLWIANESHIDRARNSLLYEFERMHYKFALFMDGDQPFTPEDIKSLWQHLMRGVRVVCGLVALKSIVPTFVCNSIKGEKPDAQTGLMRISDGGTGCMAFNRDILTEIREKWPELVRERIVEAMGLEESETDGTEANRVMRAMAMLGLSGEIHFTGNPNTVCAGKISYAYFASGVTWREGRGDWLSEDWMFCHRLKLIGIPVYADLTVNLKHLGRQLFPPPPEEIIEAALKVTAGQNPPFSKQLAAEVNGALQKLWVDFNNSSISVLHATRHRPAQALKIRDLFMQRANNPQELEYIFAVDEDDEASKSALSGYPTIIVKGGNGIVPAINAAAAESKGRILVMAADDCLPPHGWDTSIREMLAGQLHEPRLLWTSDGYSEQPVICHPIMTRAKYEQQGWFFCPEYPHLFCDTELTVRAMATGEIVDGRHLTFKHEHPMWTGAKPDALHIERNSAEARAAGMEIFKRRNPGVRHPHVT